MAAKKGRPRAKVDESLLRKLAMLHLSEVVMADVLEVSRDTLRRHFATKIELWKSQSKAKIAEVLFDEGVNKREPWALKALAQKHLDYSDKQQVDQASAIIQITIQKEDVDL